jgi:aldehyde dehydrogenase (NAD+)
MSTIGSEEMKGILAQLGIQSTNSGASTGSNWMNTTGAKIDSISPVDGKLIASVNSATAADYNALIEML